MKVEFADLDRMLGYMITAAIVLRILSPFIGLLGFAAPLFLFVLTISLLMVCYVAWLKYRMVCSLRQGEAFKKFEHLGEEFLQAYRERSIS